MVNETDVKADVVELFKEYGAKLIQFALFYTNPEENTGTKVLALTDSGGLERIAEGLNVKGEIKERNYSYFNLDGDHLTLNTSKTINPFDYDILGFTVERPNYLLKVAAFKERA